MTTGLSQSSLVPSIYVLQAKGVNEAQERPSLLVLGARARWASAVFTKSRFSCAKKHRPPGFKQEEDAKASAAGHRKNVIEDRSGRTAVNAEQQHLLRKAQRQGSVGYACLVLVSRVTACWCQCVIHGRTWASSYRN